MGVADNLARPVWRQWPMTDHSALASVPKSPPPVLLCIRVLSWLSVRPQKPGMCLAPVYYGVHSDQIDGLNSWVESDGRETWGTAQRPRGSAVGGSRVPATNKEFANYGAIISQGIPKLLSSFLSSLLSKLNCLKGLYALSKGSTA